MAQIHKKRTHRPSNKHRHHDPAKKQEILEKVDAILNEQPTVVQTKEESATPVENISSAPQAPAAPAQQIPVQPVVSEPAPAQPVVSVQPQQETVNQNAQNLSRTLPVQVQTPVQATEVHATPSTENSNPSGQVGDVDLVSSASQSVSFQQSSADAQNVQPAEGNSPANPPPWRETGKENAEVSDEEGSLKKKILTILLFAAIFAVSIGGGYLIYSKVLRKEPVPKSQNQEQKKTSVTPVVSPQSTSSATITPSASKSLNLSKYNIKVLNGSGKRGVAAKVKSLLEEENFVVTDIGNADASDYTKTVIKARKDIDDAYLKKLKEVLGKEYIVGGTQEIDAQEKADVIVIVGSSTTEK